MNYEKVFKFSHGLEINNKLIQSNRLNVQGQNEVFKKSTQRMILVNSQLRLQPIFVNTNNKI